MRRGARVVVRRGGRVDRIRPSAERRLPRGHGVLLATGVTLGLAGGTNLALSASATLDAGAPALEALLLALYRLPPVAVGAGLVSFAIVRDPGPWSVRIGAAAIALLALALVVMSALFGASLPELWSQVPAEGRGRLEPGVPGRLELGGGAVQLVLYTALFLYLAFAVWRSRIRMG